MAIERHSVSFTDPAAALAMAATVCPTDALVVMGGDAKHPCQYIHSAGELAGLMETAGFGSRPFDRVCVWVPADQIPRPLM